MHNVSYLDDTLILLIAAVAVVFLFHRLKVSPILGYLFAGLIIGPQSLGFITSINVSRLLGELGVVFLLFTIGLKMPLQRLRILRHYIFGLGMAQVVVTTAIFTLILHFLNLNIEVSFLIASVLALSSTAVGIQLLVERGEIAMRFGRISFAILLFQDLAVVVLLMLITAFKDNTSTVLEIVGISTLKASIVLFGIILIGADLSQTSLQCHRARQQSSIVCDRFPTSYSHHQLLYSSGRSVYGIRRFPCRYFAF